jgi:hypothetical protein
MDDGYLADHGYHRQLVALETVREGVDCSGEGVET